ncbi:matrix metalloproteinase-17b isoform X1 [Puntigrus tetrazona]|uniref:matrix metalloproteinase-17b isoform X1 n=2 Tax=Puntigrus tetrazona TaxID=1606681 RepID=UPI001C89D4C1|nr:matrix metalloproteinase-17b isoform X1 [Puntigrus tetrazona]
MMAMFWTAVVFYMCGQTVEVYGAVDKDTFPTALSSTLTSTALPTVLPTEDESIKLVDWLTKYGYLPPPDPSTGQLQAWTAVTQAVKKMQRFAGLGDTGVLDEETVQLMQTPRCSLPDDDDQTIQTSALHSDTQNQRIKRAASTWTRRNINWRLRSYPASSKLSRETIRSLVYYALRVWADPTLLEFHEVRGPEGADLQIDFLRGPHGDGYPFDGAGGSVGHAFFPSDPDRAGGVHLDAEEEWAFRQPAAEGTDLFTVLVHELGHALGLTHSSARQSIMRPYYQGPLGDPLHFSLGHHDLQHITALYGKRGNHVPTDRPLLVTEAQPRHRHGGVHRLTHMYRHAHSHLDSSVDRCNTSFDAVAKIRGEIFFFKGQNMWRVSRGGLVSVRAVPVQRLWSALPSSLPPLQAVLERHTDHAIIFISGSQVWLFKDLSLQEGFPQPRSALAPEDSEGGWQGLHWDPKQGVVWGSVREDQKKEEESEVWRELIEEGVNGIIVENDGERARTGDFKGSTYLFKGNSYWKFTHPGSTPEEGYPRLLATDWLDCPQPSSYSPGDISLISHYGQQELHEQKGQRIIDQIIHKEKNERDKRLRWDCPCLNSAVTQSGPISLLPILFLITGTYPSL